MENQQLQGQDHTFKNLDVAAPQILEPGWPEFQYLGMVCRKDIWRWKHMISYYYVSFFVSLEEIKTLDNKLSWHKQKPQDDYTEENIKWSKVFSMNISGIQKTTFTGVVQL